MFGRSENFLPARCGGGPTGAIAPIPLLRRVPRMRNVRFNRSRAAERSRFLVGRYSLSTVEGIRRVFRSEAA